LRFELCFQVADGVRELGEDDDLLVRVLPRQQEEERVEFGVFAGVPLAAFL